MTIFRIIVDTPVGLKIGKNKPGDAQLVEAEQCAAYMKSKHDAS